MQENPGPPPYAAYPYPPPQPSWFVPVPSGARYDHLARTPVARPWRQVVGTLVVACGFFLVAFAVLFAGMLLGTILGIPEPADPEQISTDPVFAVAQLLLSLAVVLPLVFGTVALVQRRRPGTISSVAGRLRWGWMLRCVALAVLALVLGQAAQLGTLAITGERVDGFFGWAGWGYFLPAIIVIVLLVPFQAAAEEYVFRGWFLQAFGAHVGNPVWSILISSAVFAGMHGYSSAGLVDVFLFGVVMGFLAVRTGGLEAPIALHVVNNMMAFGLSAASGRLDDALVQDQVPWQSLAGSLVQLGVFAVGVVYLAKKRSVSVFSG